MPIIIALTFSKKNVSGRRLFSIQRAAARVSPVHPSKVCVTDARAPAPISEVPFVESTGSNSLSIANRIGDKESERERDRKRETETYEECL